MATFQGMKYYANYCVVICCSAQALDQILITCLLNFMPFYIEQYKKLNLFYYLPTSHNCEFLKCQVHFENKHSVNTYKNIHNGFMVINSYSVLT